MRPVFPARLGTKGRVEPVVQPAAPREVVDVVVGEAEGISRPESGAVTVRISRTSDAPAGAFPAEDHAIVGQGFRLCSVASRTRRWWGRRLRRPGGRRTGPQAVARRGALERHHAGNGRPGGHLRITTGMPPSGGSPVADRVSRPFLEPRRERGEEG
jgi:hypothetical protein